MIDKVKVREYYDNSLKILDESGITPEYKNWIDTELIELEKIVSRDSKVLEVGAGNGRVMDKLDDGSREIIGIEIANLSNLRKKYLLSPSIKILEMDAENLSFEGDSFDFVIIAYNTLGLMENPLKVLQECKRVIRTKGKILISTYGLDGDYCLNE